MVRRLPHIIPLFPLPDLVFFPHVCLPLHIFEPRYRAMVRDALDTSRIIGMTLLKDGWEDRYYGHDAPIHTVGCAGKITAIESMEDGRSNITLFGLTRFSIRDEFHDTPYRQGWIEPFHDRHDTATPLSSDATNELQTLLQTFGRIMGQESQIGLFLRMRIEEPAFLNIVCSELPFTSIEKQFLLESVDPLQQAKRLMDLLRFSINRTAPKTPSTRNVGSS